MMTDTPSLPVAEMVARLLLAAALGGLIGIERELRQKAAGLRTNILIAMGSALFTLMSIELAASPPADPTRIASQIVTGIGFLGGGAILRQGATVKGLTTAATIWMNAAIGVAVGGGRYRLALLATATTVVTLTALVPLDRFLESRDLRRNPPTGGRA